MTAAAPYTATCERCGVSFTAASYNPARYCSDNCRKRACDDRHRANCQDCGNPLPGRSGWRNTVSGHTFARCRSCEHKRQREQAEPRAKEFERLWNEGRTVREIADEFGKPLGWARAYLHKYRERGFDLPFRRDERAIANIRAGVADYWEHAA